MCGSLNQLIDEVLKQHRFGEPWRLGEKHGGIVVPILRREQPTKRTYLMLEEVKDQVVITDTGSINQVGVQTQTDKPVFIRGGGILKSEATQPRAVQFGVVILPQKTETVPVQCVHAAKAITPSVGFIHEGYAPHLVAKALYTRNQHRTWSAVSRYTSQASACLAGIGAPTAQTEEVRHAPHDLVKAVEAVEKFKTDVEEALRKIPADLENQVGVAILDLDGVAGVEVFDHPESWHALSKSVMRQYKDIIVEQKVPSYLRVDMETVKDSITAFIEKARNVEESEVYEKDGTKTAMITNDEIVGEYTILNDEPIHLLLTRKEKEEPRPRERPMAPLIRRTWTTYEPSTAVETKSTTGTPAYSFFVTTSAPTHYFNRKDAFKFLSSIKKEPKTWAQLEPKFRSTHTLQRRVKEALSLGLVERKIRETNGKPTYTLTALGQETLKKSKSAEAS